MGLAVLIKSTASNIASTEGAHMDGVVADLARAQMYEIEEREAKEGFQDTDDQKCGDFEDEGWKSVTWCYDVQPVELPALGAVQNMASQQIQAMKGGGSGSGSGSGAGSDATTAFGNSALGGMLGMFGGLGGMGGMGSGSGLGGMSAADAQGGAFIQSQYELVKLVLKESIRKVTLTVKWEVMQEDRSMVVVEYLTDAAGMNKVLGGLGSQPIDNTTTNPPGGGPASNTTPNNNPGPGVRR
jgi:hypothetical protein